MFKENLNCNNKKLNPFNGKTIVPLEIDLDDFHENKTPAIVSPWIIRRWDVLSLARFFYISGCNCILDIGCAYGFLSYLVAMEGLPITGIDKSKKIKKSPFKHSLLSLEQRNACDIKENNSYDGVLVSWPSRGCNFANEILKINPRTVAYVVDTAGKTGDYEGRYLSELLTLYRPLAYWDNISHKDINSTLYRIISGGGATSLVPDIYKTSHNRVILFLHRELSQKNIIEKLKKNLRKAKNYYPWEKELDKYYMVGENISGGKKSLWKIKSINSEVEFLRNMAYNGIVEKGISL